MPDSFDSNSASLQHDSELFDDLPPVQPPSAGFIVQLFVVPGLIVLAVVAVWALFGRIAAGDHDWRKLALELQSPNTHIRNRAMYGLAQVLDQDRRLGDSGLHLSHNLEIGNGLSNQLLQDFKSGSRTNETVAIQLYLTRALGLLDAPETNASSRDRSDSFQTSSSANSATLDPRDGSPSKILEALKCALEPTRDIEVRKSAAASIAFIAGRAYEQQHPLDAPELVNALVSMSTDQEPILKQAAAFALGLFQSSQADQQLLVLLENEDWMTQLNAAVALSRNGSKAGLAVFKRALTEMQGLSDAPSVESFTVLKNTLKAIAGLGPSLEIRDKTEFRELVTVLMQTHPEPRIRIDAQNALHSLKSDVP